MKFDKFDIAIANIQNKAEAKKDNTYYYKPDSIYTFVVTKRQHGVFYDVLRKGIPVDPKKVNTRKRFVNFLENSKYSYLLELNPSEKETNKQLSFISMDDIYDNLSG